MTIRARIRAAIRAGHQNPATIAEGILPRLSVDEIHEALRAALPYLVRDEIRKFRHDALSPARTEARGDPGRRWQDPDTGRYVPAPDAAEQARRRRAAGQKAADASQATRDRNAALLRTPIAIRPGEYKQLGDCTPDDLRTVARGLRERAAENERRADGFERLAGKLEAAGASTVSEYQGELREQFATA